MKKSTDGTSITETVFVCLDCDESNIPVYVKMELFKPLRDFM